MKSLIDMHCVCMTLGVVMVTFLVRGKNVVLPSDDELDAQYSITNGPIVLSDRIRGLWNDVNDSRNTYSSDDWLRIQSVLLTNMVQCPFYMLGLRVSDEGKKELLRYACALPLLKTDTNALLFVLDYLGSLQIVSTNNMAVECMAAWNADAPYREQLGTNFYGRAIRSCSLKNGYRYPQQTPYMNRYLEKWIPIRSLNMAIPALRDQMADGLHNAVKRHEQDMNEIEKLQFRSNIIERAKLSDREAQLLFR